jgi:polysaccharide deacetylase family sporulation protein PdaB
MINKRLIIWFISIIGCSVVLSFICTLLVKANDTNKGRKFYEEQGNAIWEIPTKEKVIALTFDDGPSSAYTPKILDILKQYQAKATFFVVGSCVKDHPDIAKREILEGHEIANHTYHHSVFRGLSEEEIREELRKTQQTIEELTGFSPKLFRPPGGYYSDTIIHVANQEGYTVVMWSWHQDTHDWKKPGVNRIVKKVLSNARKGDIVLFHDHGGDRRQTIAALKIILPELKKRGYKFVTISELLKMHPKYRYLDLMSG